MSTASVVNTITQGELTYLPAVLAGIQAAEAAGGTGDSKFKVVLDNVSGISGAVAQVSTNPNVAAIAGMINLSVAIFNALGRFKKK